MPAPILFDDQQIFVAGFSGGGRVASKLASQYPEVFAGALYICGQDRRMRGHIRIDAPEVFRPERRLDQKTGAHVDAEVGQCVAPKDGLMPDMDPLSLLTAVWE